MRWLVASLLFAWVALVPAIGAVAEDSHGEQDGHAAHAEGGDGHGDGHESAGVNPNPLEIDPDLAIATFLIFLILLGILYKFAWGPIMVGLEKRESGIADQIASAEESNKEAHKLLNEYQAQLERSADEVRAMLDGARKDAEEMKQHIIDEAHTAAQAEKERATREIDAAKTSALSELTEKSVNIAFQLASGAVRREIRPEDHRTLVDEALQQLPSEN